MRARLTLAFLLLVAFGTMLFPLLLPPVATVAEARRFWQ